MLGASLVAGGAAAQAPSVDGEIPLERLEAEIPAGAELTLELPVSIYGGG